MSSNNNIPKMKVKVNNNNDTRLWRYSAETDFEGLRKFIELTWQNETNYIAQYEDDEGDLITIASSQDLQDAFQFARDENKKSLKIFVISNIQKEQQQPDNDNNNDTEQKQEAPKQFTSLFEMAYDFLSNQQIIQLLPEVFGVLITKLIERGCNLKADEILNLIETEIKSDPQFNIIITHPLYTKYGSIVMPYIANKIEAQQSLYPHFRLDTIKTWIKQLVQMLSQVLFQQKSNPSGSGCCSFKNIVLDIEYPAMTDTGKVIHFGVECDICHAYPIIGDRYKCSICPDWDCCTECEPKHNHPLLKFKTASKNHKNASFKGLSEIMERLNNGLGKAKDPNVSDKDNKDNNDDDGDQEIADSEIYDIECDCICGAKLKCVQAKYAYNACHGASVYCDRCSVHLYNEMVYHCPRGYDPIHHKQGFDLCSKCADKKALNDQQKDEELINTEQVQDVQKKEDNEPQSAPIVIENHFDDENNDDHDENHGDNEDEDDVPNEPAKPVSINGDDHDENINSHPDDADVPDDDDNNKANDEQPESVPIEYNVDAVKVEENNNDDDNDKAGKEEMEQFEYQQQLDQIKEILALNDDSNDVIKELLIKHKGDITRVIPWLLEQN